MSVVGVDCRCRLSVSVVRRRSVVAVGGGDNDNGSGSGIRSGIADTDWQGQLGITRACVKRTRDKDWCVVREAQQEKQPTAHFEKSDEEVVRLD